MPSKSFRNSAAEQSDEAVFPPFPGCGCTRGDEGLFVCCTTASNRFIRMVSLSQSLTEQLEGATEMEAEKIRREMKAELNLVSASDFQQALVEHVRIESASSLRVMLPGSRSIC